MNAALSSFGKIARYLANPLALIGLGLLLLYGIHEKLIDSGILPPVTPETSGVIVQVFLRYGFWVAVLLIVLGFIYAAYKTYRETEPDKPSKSSMVIASQGGIAAGGDVSATTPPGGIAIAAPGSVTIGITLEQYEAQLKLKEQQDRAEFARASAQEDRAELARLKNKLADVEAKLKNSEADLENYKAMWAKIPILVSRVRSTGAAASLASPRPGVYKGRAENE